MPPKGASTRVKPVRLQTIPKLRIKSPNTHQPNPCLAVMTSVLNPKAKSTVNYHLMRMFPKISGPRKKDGVFK
ncbi:hypothetical protein FQN51_008830 [Onygenales sp. PD_10]|nr:hypothetical protein FQN51_008830 [Onygenales sp. PD_10]